MKKSGISLCMIVKDEAALLQDCLLSVREVVDEMVVVDTGSSDETVPVAKAFGARVFTYPWNDSFCDARNFSLDQAQYEWALLLDADERLVAEDAEALLTFVKTTSMDGAHFKVYNFVGKAGSGQYTLHNALRLVRNNGIYRFRGNIHEQISRADRGPVDGRFALTDIRLHHLGYLDHIVLQKDKRNRNIPILEKELEREPDDPFTLFNLGNEYMALGDHRQAIRLYHKAKEGYKPHEAYAPHLLFRTAMCYYSLRMYEDAIGMLNEGLSVYPGCTDMMYLKGLVYMDSRRDTLALESFQKAVEMGEPHPTLRFTDGCATTRPLLSSALIYERQKDFAKAQSFYARAIQANPKLYSTLYAIARLRRRQGRPPEEIEETVRSFFADPAYIPNRILLADILLSQRLCGVCGEHLRAIEESEGYGYEKNALRGKEHFYRGAYEKAQGFFLENLRTGGKSAILSSAPGESAVLLFVSALMTAPEDFASLHDIISMAEKNLTQTQARVLTQVVFVLEGKRESLLRAEEPEEVMEFFSGILKLVLDCGAFELFERLLYVYNAIDSPRVLLSLAEVYMEKSFYSLAAATVLRSVRELDAIDPRGAQLLADALQAGQNTP